MIDLVRRLQIERQRIIMSGTLKNDKTGTVLRVIAVCKGGDRPNYRHSGSFC